MYVTIEQKPKAFFPQLFLDAVQFLVFINTVEVKQSSELHTLHLDHASMVRLSNLKEGNSHEIRCSPLAKANFFKEVGPTQSSEEAVTAIEYLGTRESHG
jgi:hypothetical protein